MTSKPLARTRTTYVVSFLALAALFWACSESGITDGGLDRSLERAAEAAKGGNGGGGPDKDPTVTAVEPDTVPQDTTIDLTVSGRDFDDGSVAEFGIDGVVTEKVRTNNTTFVDSRTLIANVTVEIDATVGDYDALVTTKRGRKGVGTEKLHITTKGKPPEIPVAVLASGAVVISPEQKLSRDETDSDHRVAVRILRNEPGAGQVTVAFTNSAAAYASPCVNGQCGQCETDPPDLSQSVADALAAELNATRSPAGIWVSIVLRALKKVGDTNNNVKHHLDTGYDSSTFGGDNVVVRIKDWPKMGRPQVELLEQDADNGDGRIRSVYRFNGGQGGTVLAWWRAATPNGGTLACPFLDDVTVTVLEGPFPGP